MIDYNTLLQQGFARTYKGKKISDLEAQKQSKLVSGNFYFQIEGMAFESWIDRKTSGYSADDRIFSPAYVLESIIRDYVLTENNLIVTTNVSTNVKAATGLINLRDDFYNGAILKRAGSDVKTTVTDYTGSNQRLTLTDGSSVGVNNKFFLTNIQGDNLIDTDSFDIMGAGTLIDATTDGVGTNLLIDTSESFTDDVLVGMVVRNTTDDTYADIIEIVDDGTLRLSADIMANGEDYLIYGRRRYWAFQNIINEFINSNDIIDNLLFEMFAMRVKSNGKYKLRPMESVYTGEVWTNPLKISGVEQVSASLSSLDSVYNDFNIKYKFDIGKNKFLEEIFVNAKGATSFTFDDKNSTDLITLCSNSEIQNLLPRKKFEYECKWIRDEFTAARFTYFLVKYLTKRKLIVNWSGDFKNYCKYEVGDQVKLNYSKFIPDGVNNSSNFIIFNKKIKPKRGDTYIEFNLMELP